MISVYNNKKKTSEPLEIRYHITRPIYFKNKIEDKGKGDLMNAMSHSFATLPKKFHGVTSYKFVFAYGIPYFTNVLG